MFRLARLLVVPAVLFLMIGAGCSRNFFRERADADVAGVITQKNHFPDWAVKNWYVYPDPRARYADPYNPDRPPYPPDDYASRLMSPNPQHPTKKTGTGRFDGDGYMNLLQQWDSENRTYDDAPAARGAPPDFPYISAQATDANPWVSAKPSTPAAPVAPNAIPAAPGSDWAAPVLVPVVPRVTESHLAPPMVVGPTPPQPERKPVVPAIAVTPVIPPPTIVTEANPETAPTVSQVLPPPVVEANPIEQPFPFPMVVRPRAADLKLAYVWALTRKPPVLLLVSAQQPEKLPVPEPATPKPADPKALPELPKQFPSVETQVATGDTAADYLRALASNQQGYRIKLNQAVELGLVNSREFQDRREDLYLAALPVTLERFNFAAQAFATEDAVRNFVGSNLPDAGRMWSLNTSTGFTKNFATGGSLLVKMANDVVFNLGNGRPDVAFSNLSLTFLQPLLRGGGFAVTLENLTQAERNLLYAMRSYARFRKLFYVATAAGGASSVGITNNPYGLQGLSVNLGRGIGGNLTAPVVGFLPLLQQSAILANQRKNITALEQLLRLYQAYREGGQQSDLQVGQVELQLINSRQSLLGTTGGSGSGIRGYLDSLDNYKLQLGLPLTIGIDPDNAPLKPIRLQLARYDEIYADAQKIEIAAHDFNPNDPAEQFRTRWRRLLTESELVKATPFALGIGARWDAWAKLSEDGIATRVAALRKDRADLLDAKATRQTKGQPEPEAEILRLASLEAELDLATFERAVRTYEAKPWTKLEGPARITAQAAAYRDVFNAFYQLILEAWNDRLAEAHRQWPKLPTLPVGDVDLLAVGLDDAYTAGIQAALTSRLDLMNARGQVVDAYRQIAVQANSLQGVLNVEYDYNAATPVTGSTPFSFSGSRSSQKLTLHGELPLVRRAQRNNYRAALISYQRQRRTLMAFEDNIANDVRGDIRELRTIAELYRFQQRVVELQYSQVDNTRQTVFAPLAAAQVLDAAASAALTKQLLDAQSNLVTAQNQLYIYWVNYLSARMALYLDLELMQLDDRGVWIDEQTPGTDNTPRPGTDRPSGERLPAPQPVGQPADRK